MDRALRLAVCAVGAAVIAGGLWLWMAKNITPMGGYDQEIPRTPPSEIEYLDSASSL